MSKFGLGLVNEFRNLLAVVCREKCMSDKATGETVGGQHLFHEKLFHGTAEHASVLDMFLAGKGDAASMYEKVPIENNREGNERRTETYMLELRDIFTCDIGEV
jgi:hypothetical protein